MLALASLNAGDYSTAAELLRADPKLPADPSLQYAFGLALVRSDRAEEAERIFSRVLAEHPDVPELNVVIGQIHAAQGDFDGAVASLRRAVEPRSDVPEANASLGDIYMRQGDFRAATEALRAELAHRPGNVQARKTLATVLDLDGKSEEALRELQRIVVAKPNYADARYLFGKILLARGDVADAIAHLEAAGRLAPEDANIQYQLGQAYQRLGQTELAARAFESYQRLKAKATRRHALTGLILTTAMLSIFPMITSMLTVGSSSAQPPRTVAGPAPDRAALLKAGRGSAGGRAHRRGDSTAAARRQSDMQSAQAYLELARLQARTKQNAAALDSLQKARALAPNSEEVLSAYAQLTLAVKRPMPAVLVLQSLVRMCPSVSQYHYLLGVGLMAIGDMPSAVEALTEADRLEPERALTLLALGLALNNRKHFADARDRAVHSLELQPESMEAVAALAEAESGLGNFDAAASHAERAVQRAPASATANLVIGLVLIERRQVCRGAGGAAESHVCRSRFAKVGLPVEPCRCPPRR